MVEGTAKARLGRALNTRTLPAGERDNYTVGEEVDYFRPANTKDASGWIGPATIADVSRIQRGIITVRHLNNLLEIRLGDLRRHLHFLVMTHFAYGVFTYYETAWLKIKQHVEHMPSHHHVLFGHAFHGSKWHITAESKANPAIHDALLYFANQLQLHDVMAVCIGKGFMRTQKHIGFSSCVVIWWSAGSGHEHHIESHAPLSTPPVLAPILLHGENDPVRRDTRYIQVLMSSVAFMADDGHKGSDADRRHGSRTSHDSQSVGSLPEVGGPLSPIEEGSESHVDSTDHEEALCDEE